MTCLSSSTHRRALLHAALQRFGGMADGKLVRTPLVLVGGLAPIYEEGFQLPHLGIVVAGDNLNLVA